MKKVMFLILIALSIKSTAQKIRFTDPRNLWITEYSVLGACSGGSWYTFGPDTIINGKTYKFLNDSLSVGGAGCFGWQQGFWVREDTIANIVYFNAFSDSTDTADNILYNYNLQVGDTVVHSTSRFDTVISVDSILIGGSYYKFFTMFSFGGGGYLYYTFIEGIGCTVSPAAPPTCCPNFEQCEILLCFSQDTFLPVVSAPVFYGCDADSFINGGRGCDPLSVPEIQKKNNIITIYPNPTISTVTISSQQSITQITITNLLGQTIDDQSYNRSKVEVDVSCLPQGVYFLKINGTEVRKFIKQ